MPNGDLLYTGSFMNTVDADPDSGQVWLVSGSLMNQLVIRLDSMGQYKQAFSLLEDNNRCDMHPSAGVMSLPGNGFAIWGAFCQYVELNPLGTPVNILSNGRSDGLLAVYDSLGVLQHHVLLGGQENDRIQQVIPTDDAVYLARYFADTVNFDLAGGVSTLANDAYQALFVAKYAQSMLAAACAFTANAGVDTQSCTGGYHATFLVAVPARPGAYPRLRHAGAGSHFQHSFRGC